MLPKVPVDQLTPGKTGPVLYVLAHQDDEILTLAKIIQERKQGREIYAVWITDGGKSADPTKREAESRAAMRMIGVENERLFFLRYPDTKSNEWIGEAYAATLDLAVTYQVGQVCSPAYEGGNIDHDVAALVAATVSNHAPSKPVHVEYPLYNRFQDRRRVGIFLPGSSSEPYYLEMDEPTRALATKATKVYQSQRMALWLMGFVADKDFLAANGLPYRIAPPHDFLARPAGEPCDYERSLFHRAKFESWRSSAEAFLKSLPP